MMSSLLIQDIDKNDLWEEGVVLERNEYLKVSGSVDTNVYFVIEGSLRVFIIDEQEEHTIRFGYKNNLIVSLDSFISGKPSELYIQALKKTQLKVLSKCSHRPQYVVVGNCGISER